MRHKFRQWMRKNVPQAREDAFEPSMTISDAARQTGLSESALRKYEAAGLILYHRTAGNIRLLSLEDLDRIRLIQHLIKRQGLNFAGIGKLWSLLPCWEFKSCPARIRDRCPMFKVSGKPCWVARREEAKKDTGICRTCEVYRIAAHCTEDLKSLVRMVVSKDYSDEPCEKKNEESGSCARRSSLST